jgi:hypothetical protein
LVLVIIRAIDLRKEYYQFGSMINSLFYNTVEGFGINYRASYSKQIDSLTNKFLRYSGKVRYGLSSEKFYASFSASIPLKSGRFMFNTGSDVLDLSDRESINQLANSINSLYYERNLLKLYESRFLNLSYFKAIWECTNQFKRRILKPKITSEYIRLYNQGSGKKGIYFE